jgi:hypothetical protein
MDLLLWATFLLLCGLTGAVVGLVCLVKKMAIASEREASKVQALLTEIKDSLGK